MSIVVMSESYQAREALKAVNAPTAEPNIAHQVKDEVYDNVNSIQAQQQKLAGSSVGAMAMPEASEVLEDLQEIKGEDPIISDNALNADNQVLCEVKSTSKNRERPIISDSL